MKKIDENWCEGLLGEQHGIFPINHVEVCHPMILTIIFLVKIGEKPASRCKPHFTFQAIFNNSYIPKLFNCYAVNPLPLPMSIIHSTLKFAIIFSVWTPLGGMNSLVHCVFQQLLFTFRVPVGDCELSMNRKGLKMDVFCI